MWWHILAFSTMFALFIVEQIQIARLTKRLDYMDETVKKHNSALLQILRGF